jgi:hypothetical protein
MLGLLLPGVHCHATAACSFLQACHCCCFGLLQQRAWHLAATAVASLPIPARFQMLEAQPEADSTPSPCVTCLVLPLLFLCHAVLCCVCCVADILNDVDIALKVAKNILTLFGQDELVTAVDEFQEGVTAVSVVCQAEPVGSAQLQLCSLLTYTMLRCNSCGCMVLHQALLPSQ